MVSKTSNVGGIIVSENFVYVNITSEGAPLNPQTLDDERHATNQFLMWASNDTVMQLQVISTNDRVKYYLNTANGQEWKEEPAIAVQFGPFFGKIPWSESGFRTERLAERFFGRLIAAVPDRFLPNVDGENILLFSRQRALEIMRNANVSKAVAGAVWTGVITRRSPYGYMVDVAGVQAWMPLTYVDYGLTKPYTLEIGEMIEVKITGNLTGGRIKRMVVSRRDAQPNPYDLFHQKYSTGVSYPAEVFMVTGRSGMAALPDGVKVQIRQRDDTRSTIRTGSKVKVRLRRKMDKEKMFTGEVERILG